MRVTWRYVAPTVEEEPLEGYLVRYDKSTILLRRDPSLNFFRIPRYWEADRDISEANNTRVLIGNKLETTINDLTPGKTYFLRVLAFSQVRLLPQHTKYTIPF